MEDYHIFQTRQLSLKISSLLVSFEDFIVVPKTSFDIIFLLKKNTHFIVYILQTYGALLHSILISEIKDMKNHIL